MVGVVVDIVTDVNFGDSWAGQGTQQTCNMKLKIKTASKIGPPLQQIVLPPSPLLKQLPEIFL